MVEPLASGSRLFPRNIVLRALAIAVPVAALLHFSLMPLVAPPALSFGSAFVYKAIFGALLCSIFTPLILRAALADYQVAESA